MKTLLIILSSLLLLLSCRRYDDLNELSPNPLECADGVKESKLCIPQILKDYCLFKNGTYWVYKDAFTGAIDCVYVTDYYFREFFNDVADNESRRTLQETGYINRHTFSLFLNIREENFVTTGFSIRTKNCNFISYRGGEGIAGSSTLLKAFYSNTTFYSGAGTTDTFMIDKPVPTYSVNNINYNQVIRVNYFKDARMTNNPSDLPPKHQYWLAPNIGVIRRLTLQDKPTLNQQQFDWVLLRYNIVQ